MGVLSVLTSADVGGAIADGRAEELLAELTARITKRIADEAVTGLKSFGMDKSGRANGAFQAELKEEGRGDAIAIPGPMITGVTWSPWLEGTSQRNSSTGFGGYRLFARTAKSLQGGKAEAVAQEELDRYVAEIGGD